MNLSFSKLFKNLCLLLIVCLININCPQRDPFNPGGGNPGFPTEFELCLQSVTNEFLTCIENDPLPVPCAAGSCWQIFCDGEATCVEDFFGDFYNETYCECMLEMNCVNSCET